MAALALGVPVISNLGRLSDKIWEEASGVKLSPRFSVDGLLETTVAFLSSGDQAAVRLAARNFYVRSFSLERTIRQLEDAVHSD
jgi:glycosyltransferase involved in cell wall biosynthesis